MSKILVVDDSAIDRKLATRLLEKISDWSIDVEPDGARALERMSCDLPDVVVTDLQMPEMTGHELIDAVTRDYPFVPVVVMTSRGDELSAVKVLEAGASSFVCKNRLANDLVDTVERVLAAAGKRRAEQSLIEQMDSVQAQFHIDNNATMIASLVSHLQKLVRDMNVLSESERLRVGVALEEALLNAAYHGNLEVSSNLREVDHAAYYRLARERVEIDPYRSRRIQIEIDFERGERLKYVIRDEGQGFNPRGLPDPTCPENLERPCGRGVLLMRTFMDSVEYNARGNEVTMIKDVVREPAISNVG